VHTDVGRFLKLNEVLAMTTTCSRLQAFQGWCAGEELQLHWHADLRGKTLVALLGRFQCATKLTAFSVNFIVPLAMAFSMDMCRNLRELVHTSHRPQRTAWWQSFPS
jgi:hypothetical protein